MDAALGVVELVMLLLVVIAAIMLVMVILDGATGGTPAPSTVPQPIPPRTATQ